MSRISDVELVDTLQSTRELLRSEANASSDTHALIDAFDTDRADEVARWFLQTGIVGARQYTSNEPSDQRRRFDSVFAALNIHDHPNVRRTCGMAEIAAVVNGHYIRTRHNDYRHRKSAQGEFLATTEVLPPEVPASVLAKPTGLNTDGTLDVVNDTQAKWMSELWTNNREFLRADLAFLEVWLEFVGDNGTVTDAADSERHSDNAGALIDLYETNTLLSAAGVKDRLENLANRPSGTAPALIDGEIVQRTWQMNYRINTVPIGNLADIGTFDVPTILIGNQNSHVHELDAPLTQQQYDDLRNGVVSFVDLQSTDNGHTHIYRITWDATRGVLNGEDLTTTHQHSVLIAQGFPGAVPIDVAKARAGTIDTTNRMRLVRDVTMLSAFDGDIDALLASRNARFEYADVEEAIEQCFGMEGENAVLSESYTFNGVSFVLDSWDDSVLDPNVPTLNSARYNRRSHLTGGTDAAGRQYMHRGFNDTNLFVAKTTHPEVVNGVSYAVPLEILVRSPIESWNPAGVTLLHETVTTGTPAGSGTELDPYQDTRGQFVYHTPAAIFGADPGSGDPADTATGTQWMLGSDGNSYEMVASHMWIFDPSGNRTRFPIYKVAQEGSHEGAALHSVKRMLHDTLSKVIAGTAIAADIEWLKDWT